MRELMRLSSIMKAICLPWFCTCSENCAVAAAFLAYVLRVKLEGVLAIALGVLLYRYGVHGRHALGHGPWSLRLLVEENIVGLRFAGLGNSEVSGSGGSDPAACSALFLPSWEEGFRKATQAEVLCVGSFHVRLERQAYRK